MKGNQSRTIKGKVQISIEEPIRVLFQDVAIEKARQLGNNHACKLLVYKYLKSLGIKLDGNCKIVSI